MNQLLNTLLKETAGRTEELKGQFNVSKSKFVS